MCAKGLKGKNCGQFDESVCSNDRQDDETVFFENDLQSAGQEESQYWQIESNRSSNCRSRWCSCSSDAESKPTEEFDSMVSVQAAKRRLHCVCIREDEYEQLNRRQLEKLNLALQPAADQLMLVSGEDLAQQNYLLDQLPLKLQKQTPNRPEVVGQVANQTDARPNSQQLGAKLKGEARIANQLEEHKSNKEIISEVLIDGELDDDRFVSVALNFEQKLHSGQVQSVCTSMLAIYSLVRHQPDLGQLNFACKAHEQPQTTTIHFYTLDNDERVLSIAEVVQRSLNGAYKLKSILKRTHRLVDSDGQSTRSKLHTLLVINVCLLFWAIVIVIMIGVLLSSHNEWLRSVIGGSRLLNWISLQLNRRLYGRTKETLDNKMNHIVIHNNLNGRPRHENEYTLMNGKQLDQKIDKQFEKSGPLIKPNNCFVEQNKINRSKELDHSLNVEAYDLIATKQNNLIKENPSNGELNVNLPNKNSSYEKKRPIQPVHL